MIRLTREEARELAIAAQGLAGPPRRPEKRHVLETIRRLGCLQIDTISVVARSAYLVLWSRLGRYDPAWLDELLHPERAVFEYWGHAASIIPIELFPYFRRRMLRYRQDVWSDPSSWASANAALVEQVRAAVRDRGPLSAKHFERPADAGPVSPWAWWGGKPANRALDLLWTTGELMIARRVSFHRHYDLAERLMPDWSDDDLPSPEEEQRVLALRAARAMGVALPNWLNDYFRTKWGTRFDPLPRPRDLLARLARQGALIPVEVEELGPGYVAAEHDETLAAIKAGARAERTTLLSPFDNLIWDRKRTLSLFDFDYRIECYTPAAKRIYGYFTLPILDRGRLIGRLDPKVDRKSGVLFIRALHFEPGVMLEPDLVERLAGALEDFARFNGASRIVVEQAPDRVAGALSIEMALERQLPASGSGR